MSTEINQNGGPVDYSLCHGCSLCITVCPAWQHSRDISVSAKFCVRALQSGAAVSELNKAADNCILCGACHAACPRGLDLYQVMRRVRCGSALTTSVVEFQTKTLSTATAVDQLLIPGPALFQHKPLLQCVLDRLNSKHPCVCAADIGEDMIQALVLGVEIPQQRLDSFINNTKHAQTLVVDNGLLYSLLKREMPGKNIISLTTALSHLDLEPALGARDLYIINSRVYHTEYTTSRDYYDRLRIRFGCSMNLDLQRVAQPTIALFENTIADQSDQIRHIMLGREVERIIVEEWDDMQEFKRISTLPVLHLAELLAWV